MNLAFSTLLIILVLLPGIVFLNVYGKGMGGHRQGPGSHKPLALSTVDQIVVVLLSAGIFHSIWITLATRLGFTFDLFSFFVLLSGTYGQNNQYFDKAIASITSYPEGFFVYFLTISLFAIFSAQIAYFFVRRFQLDLKYDIFRFKDEWFYILNYGYQNSLNHEHEIDGLYVSAIIQHGDISFEYSGIIAEYFLDEQGNLNTILLTLPHRRPLPIPEDKKAPIESPPTGGWHDLAGSVLIRYSDCRVLTIEGLRIEEMQATSTDDTQKESIKTAETPLGAAPFE